MRATFPPAIGVNFLLLREFYTTVTPRQNFVANNVGIKLCRRLVLGTSKGIYVGGTLLSILLSLYLYTTGKRETGIFVGLWAPTVLNLGQTLVESDKD